MNIGKKLRKILYKNLPFERYLKVLSRLYFFSYRSGLLKNNPKIRYPYFLKNIVKKGDVVIDIGANLGYYSCLFARWVGNSGKVYAVEPVDPVRNVLQKNTRKYACVEILPYALGQENKTIQLGNSSLKINGYVASGSHFVMDTSNNPEAVENPEITFHAVMRKGSELFSDLARLDFIKCDVEGYETVIIPEIQCVIQRFRPIVLIETGQENRPKIIAIMTGMGYEPMMLEHQKLRPLHPEDSDDILFVHPDKMSVVEPYFHHKTPTP
ncbi:MAG: FkbM family methyltransferase [Bacteroidales bacterium]|nr:FkbM family methyltransferase [Bacteroidales bacterium]